MQEPVNEIVGSQSGAGSTTEYRRCADMCPRANGSVKDIDTECPAFREMVAQVVRIKRSLSIRKEPAFLQQLLRVSYSQFQSIECIVINRKVALASCDHDAMIREASAAAAFPLTHMMMSFVPIRSRPAHRLANGLIDA